MSELTDFYAYACSHCEAAIQVNLCDADGNVLYSLPNLEHCPVCKFPMTKIGKEQYDREYGDD